ncbi:MAG: hypothetical protein DI498_10850 [Paracoccus denitrificans]|nr:MAG: hypothetical protein DI498_10850 [Paracoccus denitrificans]PZO83641.1 MAG: hypothetical protein DI633_10850 [Paracoccus denitrificans]
MVDRHHPGKAPTALLDLLKDGSCWTVEDLVATLDLTRRQIVDAASKLFERGYLLRMGLGCYQLTDAGLKAASEGEVITSGPRRPHGKLRIVRNTIRDRAWRSMRTRQRFTLAELIADARTATDKAPEDSIGRYLRALRSAGFVAAAPHRLQGSSATSNGFKLWCLKRNTGPKTPVVRSAVSAIHDPNTGEDVPCVRA